MTTPARPWGIPGVRSIPELVETICPQTSRALQSLKGRSTGLLMIQLGTTERPLVAWAIHVALDAAGIPPCVRPEPPIDSHQGHFITVLADLLWLATRYRNHDTLKHQLCGVFAHEPRSSRWHEAALFAYCKSKSLPHQLAQWLALTDTQRFYTRTMPTRQQANARRALRDQLDRVEAQLLTYALDHPDKARKETPDALAARRTKRLRLFVMLGRSQKALLAYLAAVEGVTITRQTLKAQLDAAATIGRAKNLLLGPSHPDSHLVEMGGLHAAPSTEGKKHLHATQPQAPASWPQVTTAAQPLPGSQMSPA